jgi:hypothetical protein
MKTGRTSKPAMDLRAPPATAKEAAERTPICGSPRTKIEIKESDENRIPAQGSGGRPPPRRVCTVSSRPWLEIAVRADRCHLQIPDREPRGNCWAKCRRWDLAWKLRE